MADRVRHHSEGRRLERVLPPDENRTGLKVSTRPVAAARPDLADSGASWRENWQTVAFMVGDEEFVLSQKGDESKTFTGKEAAAALYSSLPAHQLRIEESVQEPKPKKEAA